MTSNMGTLNPPVKGATSNKRKRKKGIEKEKKAPPLPEGIKEEDLEVCEEDFEFIDGHLPFMQAFSSGDIQHSTRGEKKQRRREQEEKADELELAVERRSRQAREKQEDEDEDEGVAPEALPVVTETGELKFIKPDKKKKKVADTAPEEEEKVPGERKKSKQKPDSKVAELKGDKSKADQKKSADEIEAAKVKKEKSEVNSALQSLQSKEQHRQEAKMLIAKEAMAILEAPEENIGKLKGLLSLAEDKDEVVAQLGMLTLLAVFRDICPGYRIRLPTDKELEVKVSKEVQRLRDFEAVLLREYQRFLRVLLQSSKCRLHLTPLPPLSRRTSAAINAMCGLVVALPDFNYRTDLLSAVVPKAGASDPQVHAPCCQALATLLNQDTKGEAALEAAQMMAQLLKKDLGKIPPAFVHTFLSLRFDADLRPKGGRNETRRDVMRKMQQAKKNKKDKQGGGKNSTQDPEVDQSLHSDLKEGEATVSSSERKRMQTKILEAIFEAYFRIIKYGKEEAKPLLRPTFEGLGKFAHLISVDVLGDLVKVLGEKLGRGGLSVELRALGLLAYQDVLSGQGAALNVDPDQQMRVLYNLMQEVLPSGEAWEAGALSSSSPSAGELLVTACKRMLCDARSQDMSRLAAFVKRACSQALVCGGCGEAAALLGVARWLVSRYAPLRGLLDPEGAPPGVFQPQLADPSQSQALSTMLWESSLLSLHWHQHVAKQANLLGALPLEGPVPASLGPSRPEELFALCDTSLGVFRPPVHAPPKRQGGHTRGHAWKEHRLKTPMSEAFQAILATNSDLPTEASQAGKDESPSQTSDVKETNDAYSSDKVLETSLSNMFRQSRDFKKNERLRRSVIDLEAKIQMFKQRLSKRARRDTHVDNMNDSQKEKRLRLEKGKKGKKCVQKV